MGHHLVIIYIWISHQGLHLYGIVHCHAWWNQRVTMTMGFQGAMYRTLGNNGCEWAQMEHVTTIKHVVFNQPNWWFNNLNQPKSWFPSFIFFVAFLAVKVVVLFNRSSIYILALQPWERDPPKLCSLQRKKHETFFRITARLTSKSRIFFCQKDRFG